MVSARRNSRYRKRLHVTVGRTPVFTSDVGGGGFSAEVMRVLAPGTPVTGAIRIKDVEFGYAGQVVWAKAGAPHLALRGRMGVRFTQLPEAVRELLEAAALAA